MINYTKSLLLSFMCCFFFSGSINAMSIKMAENLTNKGLEELKKDKPENALPFLKKAYSEVRHSKISYLIAISYKALGNVKEAGSFAVKCLKDNPDLSPSDNKEAINILAWVVNSKDRHRMKFTYSDDEETVDVALEMKDSENRRFIKSDYINKLGLSKANSDELKIRVLLSNFQQEDELERVIPPLNLLTSEHMVNYDILKALLPIKRIKLSD